MAAYTCLTAPGIVFETKDEFTKHYKSEWHRYNLKRKTAQLPMLSEADFEARRAAAQASAPKAKEDGHVKPEKRDARKHRQEKMKRGGFRAVGGGGANVLDSVGGFRAARAAPDAGGAAPASPAAGGDALEEDGTEEDAEPEVEEITAEARPNDSFFDNRRFDSPEAALEYMQAKYGFYVPEAAYLVDTTGLCKYLCAKVKQGRTCLFCQREFRSYRACQQHMIDKSHLKLAYHTDEEVGELSEYYDFSATYAGLHDDDVRMLAPDDDDEAAANAAAADDDDDDDGWETASDSEAEADEGPAPEEAGGQVMLRRATRVKVLDSGELLLKRGATQKVVGARWLRRYYKQNMRIDDEREAVVAVKNEANARLLAAYERANVPATSVGFFARGLAQQFNQRALMKHIKRDQQAEWRQRARTEGMRSGGKAKDFKQNKLIKHRVAGKNMGEGLGVHG